MYKVSTVASMLGVSNTQIFEMLITHKITLDHTTKRENGILFLTDDTVQLLKGYLSPPKESINILATKQEINILKEKLIELDYKINEADQEIISLAATLLRETDNYITLLSGKNPTQKGEVD